MVNGKSSCGHPGTKARLWYMEDRMVSYCMRQEPFSYKSEIQLKFIYQERDLLENNKFIKFMKIYQNKTDSYSTSKMGLLGNNRELQFGTCKLQQNHQQVWRTKERNTLLWRKGGVGRSSYKSNCFSLGIVKQ